MTTATAVRINAVNRAVRLGIVAVVILTAMIQTGPGVAGAQDTYVDGPIATGVREAPDPARPLDVNDPAGVGTREGAVVAALGCILVRSLGAAMR